MLKLLFGHYDCDVGNVMIDGMNVRELSEEELRTKLSIVAQEPFLFNASVKRNIAYGPNDLSQRQIEEAAIGR